MVFLVVGDVHGNFDGLYEVAIQLAERLELDVQGILQTGDIGAFGRESVLDKATRKFAQRDPTELGSFEYVDGDKRAAFPTYFVRGNHDDADFLQSHQDMDPYGEIRHLGDGQVHVLPGGLRVAALGGIDPGGKAPRSPLKARSRMKPETAERLLVYDGPAVDVLLCHDGPKGHCLAGKGEVGSELIERVRAHLSPRWLFFGHYGRPPRPAKMGNTWVVPLNQRNVLTVPGRDGGVGVLDLNARSFFFVSSHNWRRLPLGLPN